MTSWSAIVGPAVVIAAAVRAAATRGSAERDEDPVAAEPLEHRAREHARGDGRGHPDRPEERGGDRPARLNTVTSATTTSAASAPIPSVQETPSRRIPSFANARRRAASAERRDCLRILVIR